MTVVRLQILAAVVLSGGLGVALDFSLEAQRRAGFAYSFQDHVGMRLAQARVMLDRRTTTEMASADELQALIPAAPEGWTRRDLVHMDMERATGIATPERTREQQDQGKIFAALGVRISQVTYEKGDTVVQYFVTWYTEQALNGPQGAGFQQQLVAMDNPDMRPEIGPVVAVVNGVPLRRRAIGAGSLLEGKVGSQIRLGFISNGSDAEVLEIVSAVDMAGLNALNTEPAAGIGTGGLTAPEPVPQVAAPAPAARVVPEVPALAPGALVRRMLGDT